MKSHTTSDQSRETGMTDKYGWKFLRRAGLLSVAIMGIGVCVCGGRLGMANYWVHPNLTTIAAIVWFTMTGMMLTQLLRPSKRVTRLIGGLAVAAIFARIALNHIHLGIFPLLQPLDIPWFHVVFLFVLLISVGLGAFIQNEFGAGLYRERTVKVTLIALMAVTGIIVLTGRLNITDERDTFVGSAICSLNQLAAIFIPLAAAVLLRSRAAYRLTRPSAVRLFSAGLSRT